VLALDVLYQLILSVVPLFTEGVGLTDIRLVLDVASLVVIAVANGGEPLGAELTAVGLLSCMNSLVHLQVATLIEFLVADDVFACGQVLPYDLITIKSLLAVSVIRVHDDGFDVVVFLFTLLVEPLMLLAGYILHLWAL
jgi:hypothetical protein